MLSSLKCWAQVLYLGGAILLLFCVQDGIAQTPWQEQSSSGDNETSESREKIQEKRPFIDGIVAGVGLAIYQGDFSRNPNHNIFKYLGTAKPNIKVGVDRRLGIYEQYGVGADLTYSHISGATSGRIEFSNNMISVDLYADYELPYIKLGLFRVFVGGGPLLLVNPKYQNFPEDAFEDEKWRPDLGTRVVGSGKVGVTIFDSVQIGTRITTTDLLDGYLGFYRGGITDIVSFIRVTHRFNIN